VGRSTIRARLIRNLTTAILIPSNIIVLVGVLVIRRQVYTRAQTQVNSDLESAKEIFQTRLERLKDAVRIHATRMVLYRALEQQEVLGLPDEMERIRGAEGLDILTVTDASCRVFYRTRNPGSRGDSRESDPIVRRALEHRAPVSGAQVLSAGELAAESGELAGQAAMDITPTPMAAPSGKTRETGGMVLKAAAPVFLPSGRFLGILYGAVLINRNYEIVDKVRRTVFKQEIYDGREVGTATIFLDDVRISTNVVDRSGRRAIATRASAEVADAVLKGSTTWRGSAFVVNDWYLSAYSPIHDVDDRVIGMLYVGVLEKPYRDTLWRTLLIFLGSTLLCIGLVSWVAIRTAGRISRPLHEIAEAAGRVADGDYSPQVDVPSSDEIGHLAESFNRMVRELDRAHQELRDWTTTLEKRVEDRTAQLKAMQSQLIRTEKLAAIGKLAAGVAHEINNPLTGVLTNSSLMLQDLPPDDPRREDLQIIVDETLRCRKIVKGLLDFARQSKPQKQLVDLNRVAEDVLSLVRNQASFRDIALEVALDPALPAVMADRDQMRQVVLNTILNAAEAMPRGGAVRVSSRMDTSSGEVELTIRDSGPGIPPEIIDRLFEPFFTTKKTGTGLGLAIAYGIMEGHKGSIRVESTPAEGTTVRLRLPAGQEGEDV
jgi:two-component system, NtrC family, sensor kinase